MVSRTSAGGGGGGGGGAARGPQTAGCLTQPPGFSATPANQAEAPWRIVFPLGVRFRHGILIIVTGTGTSSIPSDGLGIIF